MQLLTPKYSFVNFQAVGANFCCTDSEEFCIPVAEENDTYFSIKITSEKFSDIQYLLTTDLKNLQLMLLNGNSNNADNIRANLLRNWTADDNLLFERNRTAVNEVTFQWKSPFKNIKGLVSVDDCFQLGISLINTETTGAEFSSEFSDEFTNNDITIFYVFKAISNVFKRTNDYCYTSILEYTNEQDYADFRYCNITNPLNRVRLPFYLNQAQPVEDKAQYRKTNGQIKQTKSLLTKEYQVQTEYFTELIHDKVMIALAHGRVNVIGNKYTGGISKNSAYVIDWTDNLCKAPANFKALAIDFMIKNNTCSECLVIPICNPVAMPEFLLADAKNGMAYSQSVTLAGTAPFSITDIQKPAWLSIALNGSVITFSGTPANTDIVTSEIKLTANNDCGLTSIIKLLSVIDTPCVPVAFVGTPILPDGQKDKLYKYSIGITGKAPFNLSAIVKPAWMAVELTGTQINLSGTPAVVATNITVSFGISNCGEGTLNFSDTIDVISADVVKPPIEIQGAVNPIFENECISRFQVVVIANQLESLTVSAELYTGFVEQIHPASPITYVYTGQIFYIIDLANAGGQGYSSVKFRVKNNTTGEDVTVILRRTNDKNPC